MYIGEGNERKGAKHRQDAKKKDPVFSLCPLAFRGAFAF